MIEAEIVVAALWVAGISAAALFVVQGVSWALLRRKRLGLARWESLARVYRILGYVLLLSGVALFVSGRRELAPVGSTASIGGAWNVLVATIHLATARLALKSRQR